jgi:hypothetical protein
MLPWHDIHEQIAEYAAKCIEHQALLCERLLQQYSLFQDELAENWEVWRERLLNHKQKHLMPLFDESPTTVYEVPTLTTPPMVISSDGSQLIPNRHEAVLLALINISRICIDYLHYDHDQILDANTKVLSMDDYENIEAGDQRLSFDDQISDRRDIDEIKQLLTLVIEKHVELQSNNQPALLMLDGSLIKWGLAGRPFQDYKDRITKEFVSALIEIQSVGIPISGYISHSGGREMVRLLEWMEEECGKKPKNDSPSLADPTLTDVMIFNQLLKPGQRSTVFEAQSDILKNYKKISTDNGICYFFLHVGSEVAKVEIPLWVSKNTTLVDQCAAICIQQAELGQGYPIALSQAHEFAVIRGADRKTFQTIVEQELNRIGIFPEVSQKLASKNHPVI